MWLPGAGGDTDTRGRAMNERSFVRAVRTVMPVDMAAAQAAAVLHNQLTKPPGSLGRLERLGVQLAAIAGRCPPPDPEPVTIAVFAAEDRKSTRLISSRL